MADTKISNLTALTNANVATDDVLVIVDTSATETKKITVAELDARWEETTLSVGGAAYAVQYTADGSTLAGDESVFAFEPATTSLIVGTDSAAGTVGGTSLTGNLVIANDSGANTRIEAGLQRSDNVTADLGAKMFLARSRGTIASKAVVQANDTIGEIWFAGWDGTDWEPAAKIACHVDGTPGNNDMPGHLCFHVSADGSASPVERMSIANDGVVSFTNYSFPLADGTIGQFLKTDGAGNLSFDTVDLTPPGADTQIIFNDSGAYGASANLTFDGGKLTVVGADLLATSDSLYCQNSNGSERFFVQNDGGAYHENSNGYIGLDAGASTYTYIKSSQTIALSAASGRKIVGITGSVNAFVADDDEFAINNGLSTSAGNHLYIKGATTDATHNALLCVDSGSNSLFEVDCSGQITAYGNMQVTKSTATDDVLHHIYHSDNTDGSSHAVLRIQTGGSSGGDPKVELMGPSWSWSFGVDNSNSDQFRISADQSLGSNNAVLINPSATPSIELRNATKCVGATADNTASAFTVEDSAAEEQFDVRNDGLVTHSPQWKDNTASFYAAVGGGSNAPTFVTWLGGIMAYSFSAGTMEEVHCVFHMNHDVDPGSTFHFHIHWCPEPGATNTGTCRWGIEWTIAQGYSTDVFGAPSTVYIEQAASGTPSQHQIAEDATGITNSDFVTDALIVCRVFRDAAHANDTFTGEAIGLMMDIHYQADKVATPNRNSPFF